MANPITWRNVTAPSLTGSLESIGRGNESIMSGIDRLQKAAGTYSGNLQNQREDDRTAATQSISNLFAGAESMEDYERLKSQYTPEAINAMGDSVDGAQLINLLGNTDNRIREDITQTQAFAQSQEAPIVSQAQALLAGRKYEEFDKLMGENPNLSAAGSLLEQRLNTVRGDKTHADGQATKARTDKELAIDDTVKDSTTAALQYAKQYTFGDGRDFLEDTLLKANVPASKITAALNEYKKTFDSAGLLKSAEEENMIAASKAAADDALRRKESRIKLNTPKSADERMAENTETINAVAGSVPEKSSFEKFFELPGIEYLPPAMLSRGIIDLVRGDDLTRTDTKDFLSQLTQGTKAYKYDSTGKKIVGIEDATENTKAEDIVKLSPAQVKNAAASAQDAESGALNSTKLIDALIRQSTSDDGQMDELKVDLLAELRNKINRAEAQNNGQEVLSLTEELRTKLAGKD